MPLNLERWINTKAFIAERVMIPLISTEIAIKVRGGVATVVTTRLFRNTKDRTIEATTTIPVPVAAVLYDLRAIVEGRTLVAHAEPKKQARETYENAIDDGKTAVLHEELLPGIHQLIVGHIPPGKDIVVISSWTTILSHVSKTNRQLIIPTTVGDIYGTTPLTKSQDIVHGSFQHKATVSFDLEPDIILEWEGGPEIILDHPLVINITGVGPGVVLGVDAHGDLLGVATIPHQGKRTSLDLTILVDVSGSMDGNVAYGLSYVTKLGAVKEALKDLVTTCTEKDRADVWAFSDKASRLGQLSARVANSLETIGGTEIGIALDTVISSDGRRTRDILLITDGKSWSLDVQRFISSGYRITVLLIGEDALEANVGYLASITGGEIFISTDDTTEKLSLAIASTCRPHETVPEKKLSSRPASVRSVISGLDVEARWFGKDATNDNSRAWSRDVVSPVRSLAIVDELSDGDFSKAVGAIAARLSIPYLTEEFATVWAVSHNIVSHLTSLVLVDEEGTTQKGIPTSHKVAVTTPRVATYDAAGRLSGSTAVLGFSDRNHDFFSPRESAARGLLFSTESPTQSFPKVTLLSDEPGNYYPETGIGFSKPSKVDPILPLKTPLKITLFNRDLASKVEWGKHTDLLSRGVLSCLPGSVMVAVVTVADMSDVFALATSLNVPVRAVAIALLALFLPETEVSAHRISRAVLKNADPTLLLAAKTTVGL